MSRKSTDRLARYIPTVQLFAARLVLFHQQVAERLGLTATEFKCFRLLEQLGPLSMTALAHEAGLKIGTVSGLIDKLEAAGFVRRQRDAMDKRAVILAARPEAAARADDLYREQGHAMAAILDAHNERDFNLLMTFLADVGEVLAQSQRELLNEPGPELVGPQPGTQAQKSKKQESSVPDRAL